MIKELDVLVLQAGRILNISKAMIFVNKIEDRLKIAGYLRSLLLESMHKKRDQIIWILLFNLELSRQEFFIEEFKNGNTHILICTDVFKMGVNIRDMAYAI